MSRKYELAEVLRIRERRRDEAEKQWVQAKQMLERRQRELAEAQEAERKYRDWCRAEARRLFDKLENADVGTVTNQDLVETREQVKWNWAQLVHYQKQTEDAAAAVAEATDAVHRAELAWHQATKEVMTIEEHKANWEREQAAAEMAADEAELEEIASAQFVRRSRTSL